MLIERLKENTTSLHRAENAANIDSNSHQLCSAEAPQISTSPLDRFDWQFPSPWDFSVLRILLFMCLMHCPNTPTTMTRQLPWSSPVSPLLLVPGHLSTILDDAEDLKNIPVTVRVGQAWTSVDNLNPIYSSLL